MTKVTDTLMIWCPCYVGLLFVAEKFNYVVIALFGKHRDDVGLITRLPSHYLRFFINHVLSAMES